MGQEDLDRRLEKEDERIYFEYKRPEVREVQDLVNSREIYKSGEVRLNFYFQFDGGEILRASENDEGIASIVIERAGNVLVDMKDYIPEGFRMVTPTYLNAHKLKQYAGLWHSRVNGEKIISIGDMRNGRHILAMLHELGHTKLHGWEKDITKELYKRRHDGLLEKEAIFRKFLEGMSMDERSAWAEGLKIARRIKKLQKINLLEPVKNLEGLNQIIYGALTNHRIGLEAQIMGDIDVEDDELDEQTKKKFLTLLDAIKKLFDKEKLVD